MRDIKRRDFVATAGAAGVAVAIGAGFWPLADSMNPSAEIRARRKPFHLSELAEQGYAFVVLDGEPILIFRRSNEQLKSLEVAYRTASVRDTAKPLSSGFVDRASEQSAQPEGAQNWYRSLRPELMVCSAVCTHDHCLVRPDTEDLVCPCCGSRFDLAGRAILGPAPQNLSVPAYRFDGASDIEFL